MNYHQCHLCKQEFDAYTAQYADTPFVDGRKYKILCDVCMMTPKKWIEKDNELIIFDDMVNRKLKTVEELMNDGVDKKNAEVSVRAIKSAVRKYKARMKK